MSPAGKISLSLFAAAFAPAAPPASPGAVAALPAAGAGCPATFAAGRWPGAAGVGFTGTVCVAGRCGLPGTVAPVAGTVAFVVAFVFTAAGAMRAGAGRVKPLLVLAALVVAAGTAAAGVGLSAARATKAAASASRVRSFGSVFRVPAQTGHMIALGQRQNCDNTAKQCSATCAGGASQALGIGCRHVGDLARTL